MVPFLAKLPFFNAPHIAFFTTPLGQIEWLKALIRTSIGIPRWRLKTPLTNPISIGVSQ